MLVRAYFSAHLAFFHNLSRYALALSTLRDPSWPCCTWSQSTQSYYEYSRFSQEYNHFSFFTLWWVLKPDSYAAFSYFLKFICVFERIFFPLFQKQKNLYDFFFINSGGPRELKYFYYAFQIEIRGWEWSRNENEAGFLYCEDKRTKGQTTIIPHDERILFGTLRRRRLFVWR